MANVIASNLGFPRVGALRELKKAVEGYWKDGNLEALQTVAKQIRAENWKFQQQNGIQHIPSNDFSLYDHVLDTITMVDAIPARYRVLGENPASQEYTDQYFAMARGGRAGKLANIPAMEMTKWLDTNYHYIVPEFTKGQTFKFACTKVLKHFEEAKALGITTRPVLVGPVSFLLIGKMKDGGNALDLLPALLPVYTEILAQLKAAGAEWVQIDEPALALDLNDAQRAAFKTAYATLSKVPAPKTLVATYFTDLGANLETALNLGVNALHLDIFRGEKQLDEALAKAPANLILSLGVVEGRNIWKNDFSKSLAKLEKAVAKLGKERVIVAPSCSLLHSPVDLNSEDKLDAELKNWLAFARQKIQEVSVLARAINEGRDAVKAELEANAQAMESRRTSARIHNPAVKARVASITPAMAERKSAYPARAALQAQQLNLPLFPTTTIGSFPQTEDVRAARAANKAGKLNDAEYNKFLEQKTAEVIKWQEEIGLDVLVHGEFERNDMVEYFGEQLSGFAFSKFGWVQSYGSRCVKPPIIFGDVSRPTPMTVQWATFSQSQTKLPMKGMLTGPITILQWSFVRDDQPRETTTKQIALAIRDEVTDLEKAGIKVIQIDEAALREGLPLHRAEWADYLRWAVESFRITASGVEDQTQIHTHMCYSEFNDIIQAVGAMDADVISIETSRSQMELLDAFVSYKYPNEIGPGVYDIHSPIVPTVEQMNGLLQKALKVLDAKQIWVNPDCGLKTRAWPETKAALIGMVDSAKQLRTQVAGTNGKKAANG